MSEHLALHDAVVMIVDDDDLTLEVFQAYLEDAGWHRFVTTNDPRQTLQLIRQTEPSVLLLDLMMPGISGIDLLCSIRSDAQLSGLPVIVLTAAIEPEAKLKALQLGATDFLSKPVDGSELTLRVRNTLAFREYHERSLNYDPASGLPTRRLFEQKVREALVIPNGRWAVLSISVPECRQVAETLGAEPANELALALGQRLQNLGHRISVPELRRGILVARLRTEEFGLLVEGIYQLPEVEHLVEQVVTEIGQPLVCGAQQLTPTAAVGIALSTMDGETAESLIKSAELARSQAQQQRGSGYVFFSAELNQRSLERMTDAANLRRAIRKSEFVLHYQPQVNLRTGVAVGAEALIRWSPPGGSLIGPMRFIPLAEELVLINQIGDWALNRICEDGASWMADGVDIGRLSVNVAQLQFASGSLGQNVARALQNSGLPPQSLTLEITESMLIADVDMALATLNEIRALGVGIALDDFGTGYSSLSYLKVFPISELKIDRSFIVDLPGGSRDIAILRAIIALGHHLDMKVVAEGVETEEQMCTLRELGADLFQGYLFSRPVPSEALPRFFCEAAQSGCESNIL